MPKVITEDSFHTSWASFNPDDMFAGLKDEASRMVKVMDEWRITFEKYGDQDQWKFYVDAGYIDLIKKAKKYRKRIYNRNADLKTLSIELDNATYQYEMTYEEKYVDQGTELRVKISELQEEQVVNCWRIAKIYGHLLTKCGLNFGMVDMAGEEDPFSEYDYDPEDD